jgi:cytochrome bd ubiquinol oxidase subunit II
MAHVALGIIWFGLIGVLLAGYAIFDGFDLGVGALYPFLGKNEQDKRVMRTSVGPVWDGNEVWLLTGGGALFAAFPAVYATVFSGFYLALMLVLFALIFRAVSLEFRAHDDKWAGVWDWAFFGGSALPALLYGVAVGNIVLGVPLTQGGEFAGNFFTLLGVWNGFNPFALLIGILGLSMFLLQGASWLAVKTEGALYDRSVAARSMLGWVFTAMAILATIGTALFAPAAFNRVIVSPIGWVFIVLLLISIVGGRMAMGKRDLSAWYAVSLSAISLTGIWAISIFPNLVPSLGPGNALTIVNSMSSQLTLTVMLIISVIGVPLVLLYFYLIYKAFAGKVKLGEGGY